MVSQMLPQQADSCGVGYLGRGLAGGGLLPLRDCTREGCRAMGRRDEWGVGAEDGAQGKGVCEGGQNGERGKRREIRGEGGGRRGNHSITCWKYHPAS